MLSDEDGIVKRVVKFKAGAGPKDEATETVSSDPTPRFKPKPKHTWTYGMRRISLTGDLGYLLRAQLGRLRARGRHARPQHRIRQRARAHDDVHVRAPVRQHLRRQERGDAGEVEGVGEDGCRQDDQYDSGDGQGWEDQ